MLSRFQARGALRAFIPFLLATIVSFAAAAHAQSPLKSKPSPSAESLFDTIPHGVHLPCSIQPLGLMLDFSFRFDARFLIRCPLRDFAGKADTLICLARVAPAGAGPRTLAERFLVPAMPAEMMRFTTPRKVAGDLVYSAAFSVGEGRYRIEALVVDQNRRVCWKSWTIRAHSNNPSSLALKPGEVQPLLIQPWGGERGPRTGDLRLTILLDAEPLWPGSPKLQILDRLLLLESLTSILKRIPARSVSLIAFNLDQRQQIFEEDAFDEAGFIELARALADLNLDVVRYQALGRQAGQRLLLKLVSERPEAGGGQRAVIFLGPRSRTVGGVRHGLTGRTDRSGTRFFYFEYFPRFIRRAEFPDAITALTKSRGGTVFKIYSPRDLAHAIQQFERDVDLAPVTEGK